MSQPKPINPRDGLLARKVTKPQYGCTPIPCPDCPVPGVFVPRMSAARYVEYLDAFTKFEDKPGDSPAELLRKEQERATVRIRFATVDAEGKPLFQAGDDVSGIDLEAIGPVLNLFVEVNGTAEKKSPPPNVPPAG